MKPRTLYAKSGDIHIAYQVVGGGDIDIVYVPGWVSNIELMWDDPLLSDFINRLAEFARVLLFDKRGTGLSDRPVQLSTLEERMDDIRAVMDAVDSEQAAIFGHSEGGMVSTLFAATYPQRTMALITFGSFAKRSRSADYPWAPSDEEREKFYAMIRDSYGVGSMDINKVAPSMAGDKDFIEGMTRYFRAGASPGAAMALARMNTEADVTQVLESISVPTLLLYRTGDFNVHIDEGRYQAKKIKGSKFVELPGNDHLFWVGETDEIIAEIEEFLTGSRTAPQYDRVLSTIVFTDIVGSTDLLSKMGDAEWCRILEKHNEIVRSELVQFRGNEIKSTGDGFLATFDGPSRAVRCSEAIREKLKEIDLQITVGIHTGECEMMGEDIGGLAVHIASRVESHAQPNQILITETVKHLLAGSGLSFDDLGYVALKGIEEKLQIFVLR